MIGIGLDITRAGQTVSFSPENLRRGTRNVIDLTVRPNRLYSDTAGTTPIAGPGAEVAAMCDSRGVRVLNQTTASARLKYAREPASGVRNRANGSALVADNAAWTIPTVTSGITVTKVGTGETAGEPWADYRVQGTASGLYFQSIFAPPLARFPAVSGAVVTSSLKAQLVAGTYPATLSGLRLDTQELNAANAILQTSFQLLAVTGTTTTFATTRTFTDADTTQAQMAISIRVDTGATVDFTVRITAAQVETGAVRTAWQRNASEFDVTEAGVRSVHQLAFDSIDDFMFLESPFAPAGAYTMAAVRTGAGFPGGITFDSATDGVGLFSQSATTILSANTISNSAQFLPSGWPSGAAGVRRLDMVRVTGAAAVQAWRNGVLAASGITITGNLTPLSAISRLGRAGSSGRFLGGVLIDEGDTPLTDAERLMTERYLAYNGGITL